MRPPDENALGKIILPAAFYLFRHWFYRDRKMPVPIWT